MKKAYILHGCCDRDEYYSNAYPSPSNFHWIPWLQKQLLMKGYQCQTPDMPAPYAPDYETWKDVFEQFPVDENTTLIAHSCGCGFLLKWLNKSGTRVGRLIFVAPWLDPERYLGNFLQVRLKPDLAERIGELHVFFSTDEPVSGVKETVDLIRESYPIARYHEFEDKGHFTLSDMGTVEFPELFNVVVA